MQFDIAKVEYSLHQPSTGSVTAPGGFVNAKIVAVLVLAAFLMPASVSLANDPACSSGTQIKLITPFHSGYLGIGFAVTARGDGECFTRSVAVVGRPDAWRCSIGNAIQDPCFQNILGDPKVLACPDGPWSANVTFLSLTRPLPAEPDANDAAKISLKDTMPWALELANGQRCTLFTGATAPIAGMRINYGCPGGFIAVGDIDRSRAVWRIFFQGEKSVSLDLTDIAVAWY